MKANFSIESHQVTHPQFLALLTKLKDLNINLNDSEIAYNSTSGYFYFWAEDYGFSIGACDFQDYVEAIYTDPEDGEEEFLDLKGVKSITEIEDWIKGISSSDEEE